MVNYLQPTTLKLWQKNCEIICGSKTTPGLDLPHHKKHKGGCNKFGELFGVDRLFFLSIVKDTSTCF